ncbi:fungal-specific transcription factor domain-containing protein [Emericellopsis atlantica]|uniref:Fungal-specific transcription factor domain-containing protein n=1 Tax=Emericellopsis atlantica TaxID=2614577 RepID=A0A9P7ZQR9_9HYPO|nr:fungal-specific transcription factor domain-containing protein [Emericellopsis atlantica]KAG9256609.1 fungal-specific transcription factor domain-containing protein [Emericellopsis atlantica]
METLPTYTLQPSVSKACARCHARKVKCDQKVPRCAACTRQNEECNITDCVSYPYSAVLALQTEIEHLKARLQQTQIASETYKDPPRADNGSRFPRQASDEDVNGSLPGKEAEEVGVLSIGGPSRFTQDQYVGSAAGSTFARIFFKQLNLKESERNGMDLDPLPDTIGASLPPWATARFLLSRYIARLHTWWPFLQLPVLRRLFQSMYGNHRATSSADRFVVFMVLTLASSASQDDPEYGALLDMNEPRAYFDTALRFFVSFYDHPRDIFGIQAVLLLSIWMLNSSSSSHCNDLWHLSRYVMSAAIESGLHRHNAAWGFSPDELETRNRTWWCIYVLERQVAVLTGRVLSIRDHAIHALQPKQSSLDVLSEGEASVAAIFHKHSLRPFELMIRLRQLAGRVLESVYIGRGPDGKAYATSFQQIYTTSEESRRELSQWKHDLDNSDLKPSREYSELKVEYCLLVLLVNRPSPTFMVPSTAMMTACSKTVSSTVRQWIQLRTSYGLSAICSSFRQLHNVLIVALAALYCDWRLLSVSQEHGLASASSDARHWHDVAACLDILRDGIRQINKPSLRKYQELLQKVRLTVYNSHQGRRSSMPQPLAQHDVGSTPSLGGLDMNMDTFSQGDQGFEAYINNVSTFFDEGTLDLDPALSIWYDAIREEI